MFSGAEDLNNLAEKLGRTVLRMRITSEPIIHPRFSLDQSKEVLFNFALLRLPRAVPFQQFAHIRPVCLPAPASASGASHTGVEAVTAGFGHQKIARYEGDILKKGFGRDLAKFLQKLTLRILDSKSCDDSWTQLTSSFRTDPDHLCAVSQSGDICDGDKGSGLVVADCSSDSVELLGVASFTHGQCSGGALMWNWLLPLGMDSLLHKLQAATQLSGETNYQ